MPQPTPEHLRKRAEELRQILRGLADDRAVEVIEAHIHELETRAKELETENPR
jgi:hypothetical protein